MLNKQLQKNLINLGFSDHEATIYLVMLELGLSPAGPLIKKTGLHRNIVYETLNKLVKKKLVSESDQRGVKHFKALSPKKIISKIERNLNIANELVPELINLKKKEKVEVILYEGVEGYKTANQNAIEHVKPGQAIYVIGAVGEQFYQLMGNSIRRFDKVRMKKANLIKLLAASDRRQDFTTGQASKRELMKVKYIPSNLLNPTDTAIYNDRVLIFVYSESPVVIEISSKEVAKSYINYFNLLWKMAEE
jgi:sugar-specific transcriptional regulator TrmB